MSQNDMPELPEQLRAATLHWSTWPGVEEGIVGDIHAYARAYAAQQVAKEFEACHKAALAIRDAAVAAEREACVALAVYYAPNSPTARSIVSAIRARKDAP